MSDSVHRIGELPRVGPAALCMGVFDGVHLGHRALVELTARVAAERGLASVALLFDPPPIEVLRPDRRVPRLAPVGENLRRLRAAGITAPVALHFDDALRQLAPEEFLAALAPGIELRALVMTPDSAFGRSRAGTPEAMQQHGGVAGFDVITLDQLVEVGGEPVSSSQIRAHLGDGEIGAARDLLGAPPYLTGIIGAGGAMAFEYLPALPAPGQYTASTRAGGGRVELEVEEGSVRVSGVPAGPVELDVTDRESR